MEDHITSIYLLDCAICRTMQQSAMAFSSAVRPPPPPRLMPHRCCASNSLLPSSSSFFSSSSSSWGNLPPCPPRIHPLASPTTRLSFSPRRPIVPETARNLTSVAKSAAGDRVVRPADAFRGSSSTRGLAHKLQLGSLFALWYLFNIYFNLYDKQVLEVYPFPMSITTFHFGIGAVFILLMWATNLYKRPKISSKEIMAILPLAIVHTLANLFTNMSLGKVAVSFTHTIKALEPFFTVILSILFLGEIPSVSVLISLVPIVGGVALASLTEASFNWGGFWTAMASNLTNQYRNVLSKKIMIKKEDSLDDINLFSVITLMSFFLLAPVTLYVEEIKFTPAYMQSVGLNFKEVLVRSFLAGVCFHAYQQLAYMILARVSPVTHSVGNCVKRVAVIIASVIFFSTPVSPINSIGTGVALVGVFLYSRATAAKHKSA